VRTVNHLAAYRGLRRELEGARRVTVLGAGLVGTELAEDLNAGGFEVVLADPAPFPLARFLPEPLGERLGQALQANGIAVRPSTLAAEVVRDDAGYEVRATDGASWRADVVVSATGLQPVLEPAVSAGLEVGRGVVTDRAMRTSDPHILAVGDGAEVEGQCFAFIEPIQRQARAAAATIAGRGEPFVPLPPLIRVKTPSLPLAICPPSPGHAGSWQEADSADGDRLLLHYHGEAVTGFAASGPFAQQAGDLYRQIREASQKATAATP
jgi:rubredoxin-NAD+ reductase